MTITTIRSTCRSCGLTVDSPAASLVVALPASDTDARMKPGVVHLCPGCLVCDRTTIHWRTAAYLLEASVTAITAPETGHVRPRYPEQRPVSTSPMTLDDLIDLHAALERDARAFGGEAR